MLKRRKQIVWERSVKILGHDKPSAVDPQPPAGGSACRNQTCHLLPAPGDDDLFAGRYVLQ
jgi:hypothetical protein